MDLNYFLLIEIQLAPVGSKASKAKVVFDRVAVVDSDRLLEDLG